MTGPGEQLEEARGHGGESHVALATSCASWQIEDCCRRQRPPQLQVLPSQRSCGGRLPRW
jgi:hypothetical protein